MLGAYRVLCALLAGGELLTEPALLDDSSLYHGGGFLDAAVQLHRAITKIYEV